MNQVHRAVRQSAAGVAIPVQDLVHELTTPVTNGTGTLDLQRCLLRLSEDQRVVLLLVTLEDPSYDVLDVVGQVYGTHQRRDQWARWGGMAAGVLLAFGVGWMAHGQWLGTPGQGQFSPNSRLPAFVQQASVAHAVFSPEVRHPVEVTAAQQDHLVWCLTLDGTNKTDGFLFRTRRKPQQ